LLPAIPELYFSCVSNRFSLARRLRAGETIYSAWCRLAIPMIGEVLARYGFPAVTFDLQHGLFDFATTAAGIGAVHSVGSAPVVRIPVGDNASASRLLDAGAEAVIAPMINAPEDASSFVSFMKYPPVGARSWGPHRAIPLSGLNDREYLGSANELTLAFAMIETRAAFRNIVSIVETPGIDGVFVGPSDLSLTLSNGAVQNPALPEVNAALDVIADVAHKNGKIAGVHCATAERAVELSRRGYRFLGVANDLALLSTGSAAALKVLAGK
jgi:4-hydroxy-2-oxoheptanedioate aldolase